MAAIRADLQGGQRRTMQRRFRHGPSCAFAHPTTLPYDTFGIAATQPRRGRSWGARPYLEEQTMHLSNESLLVIVVVGLVAGWLAGQVMQGSGFGLIGDLIVGLLGALVGDWLLPRLNIHLGSGIVALIINAFIGAIVLLLILRLIGGRGWGYRRWRRPWS